MSETLNSDDALTTSDRVWSLLRIAFGWTFLWAFLDKTFGLGFATEAANAWLSGGSPTQGFLTFGTAGPFADAFQGIAGHPFIDAVFMIGLLGIGISLLLGIGVRIGAYSGIAMLVLMWLAVLPPPNNPFLDDHIVYAIALWGVQATRHRQPWSLQQRWTDLTFVKSKPVLH